MSVKTGFTVLVVLTLIACAPNHKKLSNSSKPDNHETQSKTEVVKTHPLPLEAAIKEEPLLIQTGRYTAVMAGPTPEQLDLLQVVIKIRLPEEQVLRVFDGLNYLLQRSGYQLIELTQQDPEVLQLMDQPIPQVHRQLGPMTLRDALTTLAGPAFQLKIDPVHRLIAFSVKPDFIEGML